MQVKIDTSTLSAEDKVILVKAKKLLFKLGYQIVPINAIIIEK